MKQEEHLLQLTVWLVFLAGAIVGIWLLAKIVSRPDVADLREFIDIAGLSVIAICYFLYAKLAIDIWERSIIRRSQEQSRLQAEFQLAYQTQKLQEWKKASEEQQNEQLKQN